MRKLRDFRVLLATRTLSSLGGFIVYVAVPLQVARQTGSPFQVGLLGLCELAPLLVTALLGGALADYLDRRRLIITGEVAMMATSTALIVNAASPHPKLWVLYVMAAAGSAVDGLQRPAIEGLIQRVVPVEQMPAAAAIRSLTLTTASLAGPAISGVLIAAFGFSWAYAAQFGALALSLSGLLLIRAEPPPPDPDRPSLASIAAGLRYARSRPELIGTYVVDICAMFFGMPMALFPFVADRFGGAGVLGLLYVAPAVGELTATATSGWTGRVHRHGLAVIVSACVWGGAIVGFGLAHQLWIALVFLAVAGGGDMVSGLFRQTIWNQTIPDRLRGRLAGVEMLSYSIGPTLGNVESGLVARFAGVGGSIISGGIACVAGTLLLAAGLPAFRRYDGRDGIARRAAEEAEHAAQAAQAKTGTADSLGAATGRSAP